MRLPVSPSGPETFELLYSDEIMPRFSATFGSIASWIFLNKNGVPIQRNAGHLDDVIGFEASFDWPCNLPGFFYYGYHVGIGRRSVFAS